MPKACRDVKLTEVSLVKSPACPDARVALFKRSDEMPDEPKLTNDVQAAIDKSADGAIKRMFKSLFAEPADPLAKALAEVDALKAQLAKKFPPKEEDEDMDDDKMQKAVDAAVAKAVDAAVAKATEAHAKETKVLKDQIAKQADDADAAAVRARLEKLTMVGKDEREELFKTLRMLPAEAREQTFKSWEQVNAGRAANDKVGKELGHAGVAPADGSALAEMTAKSQEVRKGAGSKPLSEAQAMARVIKSSPELYARHRAETARQRGDPRYPNYYH